MIAKRRWLLAGLGATPILLLCAVAKTGWLAPPRPWQQATGWSVIPQSHRPPSTSLWGHSKSGPPPRILWLGHSGFVIRWEGTTILLDPNVSRRCTISRRVLAERPDLSRLGPVDAVLISHAHFDHLDLPSLRSIERIGTLVVPSGAESYLEPVAWPATSIRSVRPDERLLIGSLEIFPVPAAHNGNRLHPLRSRELALGYVIRSGSDAIYYAGDTGAGNDFAAIGRRYRPRAAILPIGAFSPRWPMRYYHLAPEEVPRIAQELGVETVVPCHFGTFTLSLDRPDEALPRFARAARGQGTRWIMPQMASGVRVAEPSP